jgi:hypothetical protein
MRSSRHRVVSCLAVKGSMTIKGPWEERAGQSYAPNEAWNGEKSPSRGTRPWSLVIFRG